MKINGVDYGNTAWPRLNTHFLLRVFSLFTMASESLAYINDNKGENNGLNYFLKKDPLMPDAHKEDILSTARKLLSSNWGMGLYGFQEFIVENPGVGYVASGFHFDCNNINVARRQIYWVSLLFSDVLPHSISDSAYSIIDYDALPCTATTFSSIRGSFSAAGVYGLSADDCERFKILYSDKAESLYRSDNDAFFIFILAVTIVAMIARKCWVDANIQRNANAQANAIEVHGGTQSPIRTAYAQRSTRHPFDVATAQGKRMDGYINHLNADPIPMLDNFDYPDALNCAITLCTTNKPVTLHAHLFDLDALLQWRLTEAEAGQPHLHPITRDPYELSEILPDKTAEQWLRDIAKRYAPDNTSRNKRKKS